jgi:hypothetical protein
MVDRYTKLVLTVIAVCLVWIALGGPSLVTPVEAQAGDRVIIAGWIDEKGAFKSLPSPPTMMIGGKSVPMPTFGLPAWTD